MTLSLPSPSSPLLSSVCPSKKPPCVDSKRPRVYRHHAHMCYHMCAWCRYTRRRFESTHGGFFLRAKPRHTPHTQHNTHTQHTTHNTQHTTHNTQHTTHNTQHTTHNTQHNNTRRERERDRERQRKRDKTRQEKRRRDNKREETRR